MKSSSNYLKLITIFFLTIIIVYGAFSIKTKLNNDNLQNKNYLATSIREKKISFKDLQGTVVDQPLSLNEFVQFSVETFSDLRDKSEPRVYFLKDVSKYTDFPNHPEDAGKLTTVSLVVSKKEKILHTKREYSVLEQEVPENFFSREDKIEVNLKEKHLIYTVILTDKNASPSSFINYLPAFTSSIERAFDIPSLVSEVTIQASNVNYKYYSNLPMYLIELKSLS